MRISRAEADALGIDWETGKLKPDARHVPAPVVRRRVARQEQESKRAGLMTQTEAAYDEILRGRKERGEIKHYEFETETFQLGPTCSYTPDFPVWENDGTKSYHEVKGQHAWEDGIIKLKWAAVQLYPLKFYLCRKHNKRNGGQWEISLMPAREMS